MFDRADLHRHELQLFAGSFGDGVFAATAGACQFVYNFDTRQVRRKWLALASAFDWRDDFFVSVVRDRGSDIFGFI